jgi:hypothetical protein
LIEKLLNIPIMIVSLLQRKHTSIRRMKELPTARTPSIAFDFLFRSQCDHWIHPRRPPCRQPACQQRR